MVTKSVAVKEQSIFRLGSKIPGQNIPGKKRGKKHASKLLKLIISDQFVFEV